MQGIITSNQGNREANGGQSNSTSSVSPVWVHQGQLDVAFTVCVLVWCCEVVIGCVGCWV